MALHSGEAEIVFAVGIIIWGEGVKAGDRVINQQEQVKSRGEHAGREHNLPADVMPT